MTAQQMLVGNKCDLEDRRVVAFSRGQALADELGVLFYEVSAVADINVTEVRWAAAALPSLSGAAHISGVQAFTTMARAIVARPPEYFLTPEERQKKKRDTARLTLRQPDASSKTSRGSCC